jgi:hypothetical protein
MFLNLYQGPRDPGLCVRASARQVERLVQQLRPLFPELTFVSTREKDLTPSQVAVLTAIADDQERELLAALEAGTFTQPL